MHRRGRKILYVGTRKEMSEMKKERCKKFKGFAKTHVVKALPKNNPDYRRGKYALYRK